MTQTSETRRVGGAGSGILSFPGGIDNRGLNPNPLAKQVQPAVLSRLRRQRLVEHLHRLGPAPLGHFLREIENGASIPDRLEAYAQIDPAFVRALGGDRYAPALRVVGG
jgi:hypothetical protein